MTIGESPIADLKLVPVGTPTALYRFFDADGALLYVGITNDTKRRWKYHRRHAATTWWPEIANSQVEWFPERREAVAAELRAIRTEGPLYNSAAAPSPRRELAPGEKPCPRKNLDRFHRETAAATAAWQWCNADVAVAVTLANEVRQRAVPVGSRLPSTADLVNRFGVSPAVIRRAIHILLEDGAVVAEGGGTRVRYFYARPTPDEQWRPPRLPNGRDALEALLEVMRTTGVHPWTAADRIGLHLAIVRGWIQRHPNLQAVINP